MRERWVIVLLGVGIALLLLVKPSLSSRVRSWFEADTSWEKISEKQLLLENVAQKSELITLEEIRRVFSHGDLHAIPALVYSRYPFNLKQELVITAGSAQGVRAGDAVVIPVDASSSVHTARVILVGKISTVLRDAAVVETVFDQRFQTAVRIGHDGTESLLVGGVTPRLTLIAKHASVNENDAVLVAAPELPYGIAVGTAKDIHLQKDELFEEASLETQYDINGVKSVLVLQGNNAR